MADLHGEIDADTSDNLVTISDFVQDSLTQVTVDGDGNAANLENTTNFNSGSSRSDTSDENQAVELTCLADQSNINSTNLIVADAAADRDSSPVTSVLLGESDIDSSVKDAETCGSSTTCPVQLEHDVGSKKLTVQDLQKFNDDEGVGSDNQGDSEVGATLNISSRNQSQSQSEVHCRLQTDGSTHAQSQQKHCNKLMTKTLDLSPPDTKLQSAQNDDTANSSLSSSAGETRSSECATSGLSNTEKDCEAISGNGSQQVLSEVTGACSENTTPDNSSQPMGETESSDTSELITETVAAGPGGTNSDTAVCSSGNGGKQAQSTVGEVNPLQQIQPHAVANNADVGGAADKDSRQQDSVSSTSMSMVQIKTEPLDTGYEHALTTGKRKSHDSLIQQVSRAKTDWQHGKTTVVQRGKRRVRITVVRGEWRTPQSKRSQNSINTNQATPSQANTNPNTENSVLKKISNTRKTKTSDRQAESHEAFTIKTEPESSAVPTALYRNAHIKSEPAWDSYPTPSTQSDTERHRATSSDTGRHQATLSDNGRHQGTSSLASLELQSDSPQLGSSRGGRGRGRRPRAMSPLSSLSKPAKERVVHKMRNCTVRLKQLPPDIIAAGMVDLKTDPQVSKILNYQVKGGRGHRPGTRPHIKVDNPAAYHPIKKRSKHGPRRWACDICDKTYKTASGRSQHRKTHNGIKEHTCQFCGKAFMHKSSMTAHYRVHTDERPFVCKLCGAGFRWSNHLNNHLVTHSKVKPFKCEHCEGTFAQKGNLMIHLRRHAGLKPHKCPVCNASFAMKYYLATHMRRHTGERPYQCDQCSAAFSHSNSLAAHIRSHNDERPFKCHLCSAAFHQSSHRSTHIHLMHEKPAREGYKPRKRPVRVHVGPKSVSRTRKEAEQAAKMAETAEKFDEELSSEELPHEDDAMKTKTNPKTRVCPKVKKEG